MRIRTLVALVIFSTYASIGALGADVMPEPEPGEGDEAISSMMKTALGIGAAFSLIALVMLSKRRRQLEHPS